MADSRTYPLTPGFNLQSLVERFMAQYQGKGYVLTPVYMPDHIAVRVEKNNNGIMGFLGMGESVVVNFRLMGPNLVVSFSDEDWTMKIVCLAVGWFCTVIPFITGIIGCLRQHNLPKNIGFDIEMIVSQMGGGMRNGQAYGAGFQQTAYQQQAYQQQAAYQPQRMMVPQAAQGQNGGWTCPECGRMGNNSPFCPSCGYRHG